MISSVSLVFSCFYAFMDVISSACLYTDPHPTASTADSYVSLVAHLMKHLLQGVFCDWQFPTTSGSVQCSHVSHHQIVKLLSGDSVLFISESLRLRAVHRGSV